MILALCTSRAMSQTDLTLTTFNHAAYIRDGVTTYHLTDSSLDVTVRYFGAKEPKLVYQKKLSPSDSANSPIAAALGLDSLKDFYMNYCIMPTSGTEYSLTIKTGDRTKKIGLHHYYLEQIQNLIDRLNSYLPKEYQCQSVSKTNKQDCKL